MMEREVRTTRCTECLKVIACRGECRLKAKWHCLGELGPGVRHWSCGAGVPKAIRRYALAVRYFPDY